MVQSHGRRLLSHRHRSVPLAVHGPIRKVCPYGHRKEAGVENGAAGDYEFARNRSDCRAQPKLVNRFGAGRRPAKARRIVSVIKDSAATSPITNHKLWGNVSVLEGSGGSPGLTAVMFTVPVRGSHTP
jgi:hypothetical protein